MKMNRSLTLLAASAALLLLSACSVSLAQDVTPPPDYVPPSAVPQTAVPVAAALPMVPPDPDAGAPIYAEKCLPCHGSSGKGDGPQANNLSSPPPSIGAVENIRAARPVDWFQMVTVGNLQNLMPGFSGSLNDRQRWDVVAYVYSFGMDETTLTQGGEVFTEQCAACHGANGEGNGQTPDWSDPAQLAQQSEAELRQAFTGGLSDHPSFADSLEEDQQWAVTSYLRSLSFAGSAAAGQTAQETPQAEGTPAESTPEAETTAAAALSAVNISGRVVNASGGTLPAGLTVTLLGYDQMQPALELTIEPAEDGNFVFENVELNPERVFVATVDMNGYVYNSDMLLATDILAGEEARVNIHVYDSTTDASGLSIDRMHVFFDVPTTGTMQVGTLYILSNSSSQMVTAGEGGQGVVSFVLPEGATNLTFQDGALGERYIQTENGFADTASIPPGSGTHQVLFAYDLPYDGKIDVSLTPPLPVTAAVIIGPGTGVRLASDQLADAGVKDMQGVSVHLYTAQALPAGTPLKIRLSGNPGDANSLDSSTTTGLIIGGVSLAVSVALMGYYLFSKRKALIGAEEEAEEEDRPESAEDLVDAIVALDDLYQSGALPKEAYDERRAELKEKLRIAKESAKA